MRCTSASRSLVPEPFWIRWGRAIRVSSLALGGALALSSCGGGGGGHEAVPATGTGLLASPQEIAALPTSGAAWAELYSVASETIQDPDLSDQDDRDNIRVLAKALVFARIGGANFRDDVVEACLDIIGTQGGETLPLARELAAYVIAADLVGLPPADDLAFRSFLQDVRHELIGGRTLITTHELRANNWGTHAGATRIAIALYLGDSADLAAAAQVFRGWLGDRGAFDGFEFGDLWWQSQPTTPVGVNPVGAVIGGQNVNGVLPDDQRRGGPFSWPPPQENYVYEALQGALLQAILLDRAGYEVWAWSDQALLRAFDWLSAQASFPAGGDDEWEPFVINHFYGVALPTMGGGAEAGKNFGFADWLYSP